MTNNRKSALDGLRGLAACVVVIHHGIHLSDKTLWGRVSIGYPQDLPASYIVERATVSIFSGGMAVNIFFILSGAVLAQSLLRNEGRNFSATALDFTVRRIFRLYPALIAAVLLLGITGHMVGSRLGMPEYAFQTIFDNAALLGKGVNGATWTLQIEVIAIPVILAVFYFFRIYGTAAIFAFVMYAECCFFVGAPFGPVSFNVALLCFALGMLIPTDVISKGLAKVSGDAWLPALFAMAAVRFIFPAASGGALFAIICLSFFCVAVLYHRERPDCVLNQPVVQFLGRISYSLYLNHVFFLLVLFHIINLVLGAGTIATYHLPVGLAFGALVLLITIPLAVFAERFVEVPGIALGRYVARKFSALSEMERPTIAAGSTTSC
ncbi:MAG: acyltransferase [Hyphomicrobium sp.]|uniref:acyltransferase family protein n=1 Tax=Hyphomicrobium sp. TaxID=82 RepID=UPI0039E38846